jgi:dUTP pyrophosphatase
MDTVKIKVVNRSSNDMPAYATEGSSGMDLRASLEHSKEIAAFERTLIPTGLFFEIPAGYEGQVRPRSGLAVKKGLTVLNTPGTIDSDYRGEVQVILVNLSQSANIIEPGERVAQIVFQKVEKAELLSSADLEETKRGAGGFGHTGHK